MCATRKADVHQINWRHSPNYMHFFGLAHIHSKVIFVRRNYTLALSETPMAHPPHIATLSLMTTRPTSRYWVIADFSAASHLTIWCIATDSTSIESYVPLCGVLQWKSKKSSALVFMDSSDFEIEFSPAIWRHVYHTVCLLFFDKKQRK